MAILADLRSISFTMSALWSVCYSIATDYMKLKQYDKAMEYLRKVQEQDPCDPDAYYYIADLYGQQDKIDEAINTIKFGLSRNRLGRLVLLNISRAVRATPVAEQ